MQDNIKITINNKQFELAENSRLWHIVDLNNPFGTEPSIVKLNGRVINKNEDLILKDRDVINIYPVLIGG